jgi:DNA primase
MDNIIDEIKQRVSIEDLVEESGFALQRRTGRYLKCREHNSLVIDTYNQAYHWNSQDEHGDIFNWLMNRNKGWDFKQALEVLAKRANVRLPEHGSGDLKTRLAARAKEDIFQVAARVFAKWLKGDKEAWEYVKGRGWTDEIIQEAQIGFSGRGTTAAFKAVGEEFAMHGVDPASPAAVAITGFKGDPSTGSGQAVAKWLNDHEMEANEDWIKWGMIPGMMNRKRLVYPHIYQGRIRTLCGRNILGDDKNRDGDEVKSWNVPVVLGGPRQCYFNTEYGPRAEELVIVEGQADAITLGQWGMAAMATAGTSWKDHEALFKELKEMHKTIYMATDADEAGRKVITGKDGEYPLASVLGPMLRVVEWVEKDANDQLQAFIAGNVDQEHQVETIRKTLDGSEPIALLMARHAGSLRGAKKDHAVERTVKIIARMDNTRRAMYRLQLADALGVTVREFNNLVNTERKEKTTEDGEGPATFEEILGGWYPTGEGKKGWLIEYLYDRETDKAMLAFRDPDGRVGTAPHLDINGIRYVPMRDDEIIKQGGVIFASDLGQLKSTRELVGMVELFLQRNFLLDNPFDYKLAAYYVLLTWVFDSFSAIPYLRAQGDTNTGKSELMLRIGQLCYRMVISTGASSTAALKFALDVYRGTMFMDEMDIADRFDDRIIILNVGAMRDQAKVWNMVEVKNESGARGFRGVMANVYGPKLITMYGKFKDPATEGRCLTFKLMEKEPWELARRGIPIEKGEDFYREAQVIRNLLMRWRLWRWEQRIELNKELADMRVSTRINQVTMPIKQLAKAKAGDPNDRDDPELMKEIETFIQSLNDDLILERSFGIQARVFDAVVAALTENEYANLVIENEVEGFGRVKYIFYKHLAEIANKIMDEMNLGLNPSPSPDGSASSGEGGQEFHKKKFKELTSPTVGAICRKDLRLPVKRMGKGFVVILDNDRIDALRVKYGLVKQAADGKYEPMAEAERTQHVAPLQETSDEEEPEQGELL